MTPFTLDSRKMFSNPSAFTINFTEPFFPGQIMSWTLKVPHFSRGLALVVCTALHSFACGRPVSDSRCGVGPDPVCC